MLRTQRLHKTGAEQITRRLPCHQRHTQRALGELSG